ncbi:hypothetical protein MWU53_15765 [Aliiroseovarius sp. S1123]|nr:hypothetical protein [Aliiroseovarius sp. S1123]
MPANRKPRRHQMPRKVELALDRERIMREADPIGFLSDVMRGTQRLAKVAKRTNQFC